MLIVYASKTGNIVRFLQKATLLLNSTQTFNTLRITTGNEITCEKFILITYTTGIGEIPAEIAAFLQANHQNMVGVIGSGNKNWGESFCNAAKLIHKTYNIPLLLTFEMAGNKHDAAKFLQIIKDFS
ncbi:MAG: class Ib ribonucleoside-diphosphate reductase assembly flavoprotein NrdI [Alphaproteobacteria bacterium]|nr:class Ib ribonucleoside-diphosphate reductase assembly flavoprotein NrdI [Alphaproteobacteria bacterium]